MGKPPIGVFCLLIPKLSHAVFTDCLDKAAYLANTANSYVTLSDDFEHKGTWARGLFGGDYLRHNIFDDPDGYHLEHSQEQFQIRPKIV